MIADNTVFPLDIRNLLNRLTLAFALLVCTSVGSAQELWQNVERIVAIGDVHGDYDNFKKVLTDAKLINRRGDWIAGNTHFVQLGDLPDRGPDTDKAIEQMQKLQRQAREAGGKVHALIGNHEAMNIYGDLRYVHPGEFAAFRSSRSRENRSRYYEAEVARLSAANENFEANKAFRDQWMEAHPLGFVEHRMAWAPNGDIGAWVIENNAMVKINRVLFLHGGVSEKLLSMSIDEINNQVRDELNGNLPEEPGLSEAEDGPLWYRGLASEDEAIEATHVDRVLSAFDVDHIVIGHTPGMGTIVPRFGNKVIIIDTGLSNYYGGHLASLLVEGEELFTLQAGEQVPLPKEGVQLLEYFEAISRLPNPSAALLRRIDELNLP
jgi:hypothetical protein